MFVLLPIPTRTCQTWKKRYLKQLTLTLSILPATPYLQYLQRKVIIALTLVNLKGPKYNATEYLLYLSQLDVSLSKIKASELTSGALYCSHQLLCDNMSLDRLEELFYIKRSKIIEVSKRIKDSLRATEQGLSACYRKFRGENKGRISNFISIS